MIRARSSRGQRRAIGQETALILERGYYGTGESIEGHLAALKTGTVVYDEPTQAVYPSAELNSQEQQEEKGHDNSFRMFRGTTLECCAVFSQGGRRKVAALNFASAKNPGGGFLGGSSAQEESLARSSTLYASLSSEPVFRSYYQLHRAQPNHGFYSSRVIYSPDVLVFRDEHSGSFLDQTFTVDIFSCAAVNAGAVRDSYAKNMLGDPEALIKTEMRNRIRAVLTCIARRQSEAGSNYACIVLGAFGCGVFKNDVAYVATTFREELRAFTLLENVVFAVPDDATYERFSAALAH